MHMCWYNSKIEIYVDQTFFPSDGHFATRIAHSIFNSNQSTTIFFLFKKENLLSKLCDQSFKI